MVSLAREEGLQKKKEKKKERRVVRVPVFVQVMGESIKCASERWEESGMHKLRRGKQRLRCDGTRKERERDLCVDGREKRSRGQGIYDEREEDWESFFLCWREETRENGQ